MKRLKSAVWVLGILLLCLSRPATVYAAAESYTYTYDFWGDPQESPDAYRVEKVLTYIDLGLDKNFSAPQGLFIRDNRMYICDTGNNRIVEVVYENGTYSLSRIIEEIKGDTTVTKLSSPNDIYVSEEGYLYIADTNNNRVVKVDEDLNVMKEFTKPTDSTFDQKISFLPTKVVADDVGRVFVIASNINKGLIKYESDGSFKGFIGASEVSYSVTDYLWKKLSTKAQRDQMESFVATEYDNLSMDSEGFIYTVLSTFSEYDLKTDKAKPIRRLNSLGADILVKNDEYPPIGDLYWGTGGGYDGPSKMTDITVLDNDVYIGLDKIRGRLFAYDDQGHLLYAFGGVGNIDGYFRQVSAIDHMDKNLVVLDSQDCSLTVFVPTPYGAQIFDALDEYEKGNYEDSAAYWTDVLQQNGNYKMAYIGIGRALLRQDEYKKAMDYFKVAYDDINYSKAFKLYRKELIEEHIMAIFAGVFLIMIIPLGIGRYKKVKMEVELYERSL